MQGEIRIIGGIWRGRKIKVPDVPHLRPTPNRIRETLFNWLAPVIQGAYCLDMYTGSGALGFEALSRGAKEAVMIDASATVVKVLQAEADKLTASAAKIYRAKAPFELQKPSHPFDIVFLDPPFSEDLLLKSCTFLEEGNFLADEALIYVESNAPLNPNEIPHNWTLNKNKKAGHVFYHLLCRNKK